MTATDQAEGPAQGTSAFLDQFSLEPTDVPGLYRSEISRDWGAPIFPNGGVVSALAVGAMSRELDVPEHVLRTSTTMFASKVADGPIEIEVGMIRRGKRMSQLRATVRNVGDTEPGHSVLAAFGEVRAGVDIPGEPAPHVGDPDEYDAPPAAPDDVPAFRTGFFHRLDSRRVKLFQSWEEGWAGGTAEAIRWNRYSELSGPPDVFGLLPLSDTMPPSLVQYMGPGHAFFHAPSVDLTFHRIAEPQSDWILSRSRARWAGDGYASAEIHLWDQERRLVAYATQMMLVRFPNPEDFTAPA